MRVAFTPHIAALFALPFVSAQGNDNSSLASFGAGSGCPKIAPGPASFNDVAGQFNPQVLPDPIATESIRQTLALYAFAIDGRDFEALRKVFATDARANYSDPIGALNGVQAIIDTLRPSLDSFVTTQHHLGSQLIYVCGLSSAVSVTYFQATHWFTPYTGIANTVDNSQVLIDRSQYQDTWAKQWDGTWKITNRNLVRMYNRK
ncbi:ethyl tert-butyl ether degradation protein [Stemphylium lycopersici]|uniref:Ethyl tert-butyl ether degradation protein n=1 Tax=Stemphylium lycopersici TaxID=183478 RepID=A0A364NA13_STELY|nr:ethyl tert-butyl ether degradation protein [Stemphylium lycopersici]RAR14159.1 ethyl tert-butyl ether degradation protein [Stemphylium lycopersici]